MKFLELLNEFAKMHSLVDATPDEAGRLTLLFDNSIAVTSEIDLATNEVVFHAPVLTADEMLSCISNAEMLKRIFSASLLGVTGHGLAIALNPDDYTLIAWLRLPEATLTNVLDVEEVYLRFISVIPVWHDEFLNVQVTSSPDTQTGSCSASEPLDWIKI